MSETYKEENLTHRDHMDPDKHWVGESLAPPTQSEISATVGVVAGTGASPFVARADHQHLLDPGIFPYYVAYVPAGNDDATTGGTFVTWLTTGTFTVPAWATKCILQVSLNGVYMITAVPTVYNLDVTLSGGSYASSALAITGTVINDRMSLSFISQVNTSGGVRDVRIGAARASGAGQLRADTASDLRVVLNFRPS